MGASPNGAPCLLDDQGAGNYNGTPGVLTLTIRNDKGTTQFNVARSVVWDITNYPPTQTAVDRTCTANTFVFTIEAGKTYHVHMECMQDPAYDASATLLEACGQVLDTINATNQFPGLMVTA